MIKADTKCIVHGCGKRRASGRRYRREHYLEAQRSRYNARIMAEKALGRKLKTDEMVHHLDMDTMNNDPKNMVIISHEHHDELHAYLREQGREHTETKEGYRSPLLTNYILGLTRRWFKRNGLTLKTLADY